MDAPNAGPTSVGRVGNCASRSLDRLARPCSQSLATLPIVEGNLIKNVFIVGAANDLTGKNVAV